MNKEFELAQLKEALLNATSQNEKDKLDAKIKQVLQEYHKEMDYLNRRFKQNMKLEKGDNVTLSPFLLTCFRNLR